LVLRGPDRDDLAWVVARHGPLCAEAHGWAGSFEELALMALLPLSSRSTPRS
jgi:hypothetical protein